VYLETTYQYLQGLDKDSRRKAKARTKDYKFVRKDNQGPRTKAKDNITGSCATLIGAETMKVTQIRPLHATIALFSLAHLNYTDTKHCIINSNNIN